VRRARAPCDKVCVTKIFFLLVAIVPRLLALVVVPSQHDAGRLV
jgi:hypothetical protein